MTSTRASSPSPASKVAIVFALAIFCAALLFYRPLINWFGGAYFSTPSMSSPSQASAGRPAATGSVAGEIDHYTCSMHPSVKQQGPGKCPICGMTLIAVTKQQQELGVVMVDEARRQLIGVRTAPVVEAPMRDSVRAVGRVAYDESTLAEVNLKVRGWITRLLVDQTGQRVAKGQTLFTMYSPELYNAQQDFLLATHGTRAGSGVADAPAARADALGRAARQRLRLLGMEDVQIDAVAKQGTPLESIAVASPASGFIIEKNVVAGASVDAGMRLFRIAALDKVWVEADVYEADLVRVHRQQPVKVTLDYLPGRVYDAKVAYVYPYLDSNARTGRVRVEISNRDLELRPGMYASIELGTDVVTRVQVPAGAVVYTGPRRLVFVDLGAGRFKPQEVQIGAESGGMFAVLAGLKPGDIVATSGVFLIAAEARIRTATKYWQSSSEAEADDARAGNEIAVPAPSSNAALPPPIRRNAPSSARRPSPATPPDVSSSSVGARPPAPQNAPSSTIYSCPMHPEVRRSTPGRCPKCGMELQPTVVKP